MISRAVDQQQRIAQLVSILADAEAELAELTRGEIDAVVDPRSAAPMLLRAAQQRLAESEEHLRGLLARCPVLVVELERDGTIRYANPAVGVLAGIPEDRLEGASWCDLVDDPDASSCENLLDAIFSQGYTDRALRLRSRDDGVHWVEWTSARSRDEETGGWILLFGVDVTQKRDLAAAQVARAEAEAANQAKADFLAKMSHELRTPLNAISGYTELLQTGIAGPTNARQREYLDRIRLSQTHLLTLIDDLIGFARLEAGKLSLSYSAVAVSDLVELCETLTMPMAERRGLKLEIDQEAGPATVWADRDKVEQILVNLVGNAIKFTDAGGVVRVRTTRIDGHIQFEVLDNGCGIPQDKLEVIFQPFVQAENGLTRSRDGVGLGLAISRDLARAMGGDLRVRSQVGNGSCFQLIVPTHPIHA